MDRILIIVLSSMLGGFVQAVTGFGGAVIIMIFLPFIFSMTAAPAVSDVITMMLSFSMFWRYRKMVNFRGLLVPAGVYLLASTLVIYQSAFLNTGKLKLLFGGFLIVLAVCFFLFSDKVKVCPSLGMNVFCAVLGGVCGGLFGISGPPVSLYYLAATKTKEEYLGTLNAFFSITVVFNIISRISNGFITAELLPFIGVGIMAILAGCGAGSRMAHRIGLSAMRKCVYILMIFAGIISVVQGLCSSCLL